MSAGRRDAAFGAVYGGACALACTAGHMLEKNGGVTLPSAGETAAALAIWGACGFLSARLWRWLDRQGEGSALSCGMDAKIHGSALGETAGGRCAGRGEVRRKAALLWLFFFLVQLASLLAVYPGFFVYDAAEELAMVQTRSFTTHHPLLHVLALGGTILAMHKVTGSYNLGIFCYLLLQMAVMDAVFVCLIREMGAPAPGRVIRGKGCGRKAFGIFWLALCPVVTMFVLCSCKDGLFAAALLMLVLFLKRLFGGSVNRTNAAGCIASATLMMLLRNNGFYAYAVFLVLAGAVLLVKRRKERSCAFSRRGGILAAALLLPLVLYKGASFGLASVLHADASESQEILTVPIMQLARVWVSDPDSFTEDEVLLMQELMAPADGGEENGKLGWDYYNPVLSDQVKLRFRSDVYRSNPRAFWRLWLAKGREHPVSYLNAWLMTSYGFWAPGAVIDCYRGNTVYTFTYGGSSYFGYETELPGTRQSKVPILDAWYRFLSLDAAAQRLPVLSWILSPGVMAFVYAFCAVYLVRRRRARILLSWLPLFLVWLTVLLGPCALPRYVVYLWIGLPCMIADVREAAESLRGVSFGTGIS